MYAQSGAVRMKCTARTQTDVLMSGKGSALGDRSTHPIIAKRSTDQTHTIQSEPLHATFK